MTSTGPTLLLNEKQAKINIDKMAAKAAASSVEFRPHFKSHQSQEIGRWFKSAGVSSITVSSLAMADYFARDGWRNITVAIPVNLHDIDEINRLAKNINLHLLIDSEIALDSLIKLLDSPVSLWIKIDVGYHRCGLPWYDSESVSRIAARSESSANINFQGILTHAGHTYNQPDATSVKKVHESSIRKLMDLKDELLNSGIQECKISIGDTPGCSQADNFSGVDEIRPGNFVFYDLMQHRLGSCELEDIAVMVLCPVIGKYKQRKEIVIHGGAVHLSKESLKSVSGSPFFGILKNVISDGVVKCELNAPIFSASQEHGIIQLSEELFNKVDIGDLVTVLPIHSCLTANLFPYYITEDGRKISKFQSIA